MALFSGNRKVRSRRPKTAQELGKAFAPELAQPRQLSRRALEVDKQIHRLECLIADAPRLQKQQRLATLDMVPPMESAVRRRNSRLTLAQQSERTNRRMRLALEWLLVAGGIAAVIGWLNQWFHFWSV